MVQGVQPPAQYPRPLTHARVWGSLVCWALTGWTERK